MLLRIFGSYLFIIGRKEVEKMAVIYVALIVKGKRTYDSVPACSNPRLRKCSLTWNWKALSRSKATRVRAG